MFETLDQYRQILLKVNMEAAPDKSIFFLNRVEFLGHIFQFNTISPLKLRIDATHNNNYVKTYSL